jgi:hypothetical protein
MPAGIPSWIDRDENQTDREQRALSEVRSVAFRGSLCLLDLDQIGRMPLREGVYMAAELADSREREAASWLFDEHLDVGQRAQQPVE